MEEKKKGLSPILIVILTIIGTCLVGLLVWYGINHFKGEEKSNIPVDNPPVVNPETSTDLVGEKIDFPQKSDEESVLLNGFYELLSTDEIKTNFKNLNKEKNGNTFVYNCEEYLDKYSICTRVSLKINNEVSIENWLVEEEHYDVLDDKQFLDDTFKNFKKENSEKSYKVGKYYIFHNYGCCGLDFNTITIYDKTNTVYKNNLVKSFYSPTPEAEEIYTIPVIVNNVLHFIQQPEDYAVNRVKYNTIDLSKDKIEVKLVKEFTGYISGEK